MRVVFDAVEDVRRKGFTLAYLILDDHPPMARCHDLHLNTTLPTLLRELGAVRIGLWGYGQASGRRGAVLGAEHFWVERCDPGYLWRFELHPGLWDLARLNELLDLLLRHLPPEDHSAWAFERKLGHPVHGVPVPQELSRACYRVNGYAMAVRPFARLRDAPLWILRGLSDAIRPVLGKAQGEAAIQQFLLKTSFIYHRFDGPYPHFRNGLMNLGALNPHLTLFLMATLQIRKLRTLRALAAGIP